MIIDDIIDYLELTTPLYSTVYSEQFPGNDADEIICMRDPATYTETRFMDESRIGKFNCAFYCKSDDSRKAALQIEEILKGLDLADVPISDGCRVTTQVISSPTLVTKTENNEYIYTASLGLEYKQEA